MAQQRKLTRKERIEKAKQSSTVLQEIKKKETTGHNLKLILGITVAAFGFLLYIGTINYAYTLDDIPAITQNYIVQNGVSSIGTLLKTSYRYGYWTSGDELYRPLSLIMFAVEWNFFPNAPAVGHLINILFYALTGFLLFNLLCRLFNNNFLIPFIAAMLFMAHPVHTEVVANIKSGDEILSFLLSIVSINWLLDYMQSKKVIKLILSSAAFFLALMSKESALTLLAVIPLLLFVFKNIRLGKGFSAIIPHIIVSVVFIAIRASVLQGVFHTKQVNMIDNVLVSAPDFLSRMGTAIYVLGRYLYLLIFPVNLSIDYSFKQITLLKFMDYRVFISFAVYLAITIYAVYNIRKKDIVSFGILYYLITISIVSNLFVIIGTVMADRLLYLPSLGLCLIIAVLLSKIFKATGAGNKITKVPDFIKVNSKPFIAAFVILALYSFKTIDRTPIWKNNYALYTSGVQDAPLSSRTHYLLGTELENVISKAEPDSLKRIAINNRAMDEFKKAIELYPADFDAYNDIGKIYNRMGDTADALKYYDLALKYNPQYAQVLNLKGEILYDRKQYDEAKDLFLQATVADPRYSAALRNLGTCYGVAGDYQDAITYFIRSLQFEKDTQYIPGTYHMIGMSYKYMGNDAMADEYIAKEKEAMSKRRN